jgi:hypothetical protein
MKSERHQRTKNNRPIYYSWHDHGKLTPPDMPRYVMHGETMTAFIQGTLKNWYWFIVDHRGEQAKGQHDNIRYCKWVVKEKLIDLEQKYANKRETNH